MDQQTPLPPEVPPPSPAAGAERKYLFGSQAADIILAILSSIGLPLVLSLHPALLIGGLFATTLALIAWRTMDRRPAVFFKTWMIVWRGEPSWWHWWWPGRVSPFSKGDPILENLVPAFP